MLEKALEAIKKIGKVDVRDFYDDVVACFETEEEIIFNKSHNNGYDYVVYVNGKASNGQILMTVKETEDGTGYKEVEILDVWIA